MLKRQNPAFPLIFQTLKKSNLPVTDLDDLFCWENIEHCLLTLPSETWDEFYDEYMTSKTGKKQAIKTGSKELDKLEEMIASGDNFTDKLESFFLKYSDEVDN